MKVNRREFVHTAAAAGICSWNPAPGRHLPYHPSINREAVVRRHNPLLTTADTRSPLQLGNGHFGCSVDITGFQTFPEEYAKQTPLSTLSSWGWHSFPNPEHYQLDEDFADFPSHGREVPYLDAAAGELFPSKASSRIQVAAKWLIVNPHRINLAHIGLLLPGPDGDKPALSDLSDVRQSLDLWSGVVTSSFSWRGERVRVLSICDADRDVLAWRLESGLLGRGLGIVLRVPYPSGGWADADNWNSPDRYATNLKLGGDVSRIECSMDATRYQIALRTSPGERPVSVTPHAFALHSPSGGPWEVVVGFSSGNDRLDLPSFEKINRNSQQHWKEFWLSGAAMDFAACTDKRAEELERRVVLSQYVTRVNCAGTEPPQETGFMSDSWYGKFHLEMHWWHATHFVAWNRTDMFERSLPWYTSILPAAKETAFRQGYRGARWPKEVGPDGRETPSDVGVFLIWQQPHPIYYAELLYQRRPRTATLHTYRTLVHETAEFMASYAIWEEASARYVLGPPLIAVEETEARDRERVTNPTFELTYWYWGLATAQRWRERLGLAREPSWDRVLKRLARPAARQGVYPELEVAPFTVREQHPAMLAALGMLPPTPVIDPNIMRNTLTDVIREWDWGSAWGCDFPLVAMTAVRTNAPDLAVDALLMNTQKNMILVNGHNFQGPTLPAYLPGNGGILSAVALMATGIGQGSDHQKPGFPADGKWQVRWEKLRGAL